MPEFREEGTSDVTANYMYAGDLWVLLIYDPPS